MKPGKDNKEDRLNFIKYWANYVKTHSDKEWSKQQNIIINFNQLKIKVTNSLDEILKFVPVKTLIEKINNADAKTIYIKVIDKDENAINENIIIP